MTREEYDKIENMNSGLFADGALFGTGGFFDDVPPITDTFKKHNPEYLKFVDSGFGRGVNCPVETWIKTTYNKIFKKK